MNVREDNSQGNYFGGPKEFVDQFKTNRTCTLNGCFIHLKRSQHVDEAASTSSLVLEIGLFVMVLH